MAGRQAKFLSTQAIVRALAHIGQTSPFPIRDKVIVLLSAKAGLRACEIAGLTWDMVLDARGQVSNIIAVNDRIAKNGGGRRIPMHKELKRELRLLRKSCDTTGPIIVSARGGSMRPNSIVNYFVTLFATLGYEGCSSHSGRRTFITSVARALPRTGGSLRDVQLLSGHRSIETTQAYIDGSSVCQQHLIDLI